ncbi:caspase, EACC1-associated type [Nocardia cyriacigeorgica]|uniref:caspase, EACC1-associated type n=1 Tax=Nocardia cyriacigeorgica TaxID=135487 RepID=UPI001892EA17|nr:AAA domain-containing protein [Nocardia cyriacigeorgica]MBF6455558.1 caspase family protein [Nocardia cyriacigeorgica]MBF6477415.1 caspase family protein [Nocardia cyriacigeorgica]MBF6553700.1 caspase family protein [Nocardia cyriacigeorgica]
MSRMARRRALLIGNQTYADAGFDDLPSVRADLALVGQVLDDRRIGGFTEVRRLMDLSADQMREAIYDFFQDSRDNELAVLYFSGHGTRAIDTTGEFHFIATDTDTSRLEHTAVRAHYVNDQLEQCPAAQKVVIIDSCLSGGFATGFRTSDPTPKGAAGAEPVEQVSALESRGVYVVSSSRAGERSFAGRDESQPSVFTHVLVEALRTGEAARGRTDVSVKDLFEYVNSKLRSNGAGQIPVISASGVDDRIVLAACPQAPIDLASGPPPITGSELPSLSGKSGPPAWPQLLDYYSHCLRAESDSWLSADDDGETYVVLEGSERILVGAMDSDHSIEVPAEAGELVAESVTGHQQLWAGYPAVVVQHRLQRSRRNNRATKQFAPLLIRRVEVVEYQGARRLSPVGPPIVHPALLSEFMTPDEAAVFVQTFQPHWHAGSRAEMANDLRQILRNDFEITQVQELEPEFLESTLDIDTPTDGARNAAILFRMPDADSGPNKKLLADLGSLREKVAEIPRTALSAIAPATGTAQRIDDGPVRVVTPLECNEAQEAVIRSAMTQPLTVATGPPGTGKSQLVVNLVATAVANGHTVLVASTNNRAVDEVWERCEQLLPGTVIRTGNFDNRGNEQAGLTNLTRLTAADKNIQTAALEVDYTNEEVQRRREMLEHVARAEQRLLDIARRRVELGDKLDLVGAQSRALFEAHEPQALVRRCRKSLRFALFAQWRSRRLMRRLDIDDESRDPRRTVELLAELAHAEAAWRQASADQTSQIEDYDLLFGVHQAAESNRIASRSLLDSTMRTVAQTNRRYIDALLNHRSGSDWAARAAALRGAPAWAVTALSARNFPPNPGLFDLVVIDEASQCSIPAVLPLLFRAKRALVIGDPMQLDHIATLDIQAATAAERMAGVSPVWLDRNDMSYLRHSAFHAAARAVGGSMLLDEHFRCHPTIAAVANNLFYNGRLTVMTDVRRLRVPVEDAVTWHLTEGAAERAKKGSWNNPAEIRAVADLVTQLTRPGRLPEGVTIGVVTPYRPQADAIRKELGRKDIRVGTVHTFQGGECDIIIFSLVAAPNMPRGSIDWIDKQPNLWNVAITRARSQLHIVGDERVWRQRRIGQELLAAATGRPVEAQPSSELTKLLYRRLRHATETDFGTTVLGHHTDALARYADGTTHVFVLDPGCADAPPARHLRVMIEQARLRANPDQRTLAHRVPAWQLYLD